MKDEKGKLQDLRLRTKSFAFFLLHKSSFFR